VQNFILKSQTVAEKTAKKFWGPLFSAAPCRSRQRLEPKTRDSGKFGNCDDSVRCSYIFIHRVRKKIPNIIDCHLKKGHPILTVLVRLFSAQLAIKLAFNISPHPMSVSALPGENRTNDI